jgi:threonine dehydrogenase-like Zn-dependent dehydrogenase
MRSEAIFFVEPRKAGAGVGHLAEPVECVVRAIDSYGIVPGDRVLVLGTGFMGLLNVQGLARCPLSELVVADLKPRNLELAASATPSSG